MIITMEGRGCAHVGREGGLTKWTLREVARAFLPADYDRCPHAFVSLALWLRTFHDRRAAAA